MLSLFPELFNFSFVAPFVLRMALSVPLIKHGLTKTISKGKGSQRILSGVAFLSGIFIFIGLFTQVASIIVSLIIIANSIINRGQTQKSLSERIIKIAIAVSLILTGPGIFAFDLPL